MIKAKIKGLDEIPKSCAVCPYLNTDSDYPCCVITGISKGYKFNRYEDKMKECPLYEESEVKHGKDNSL